MIKRVGLLGGQLPIHYRKIAQKIIEGGGMQADILEFPTRNLMEYKEKLLGYSALVNCGEPVPAELIEYLAPGGLKLLSRNGIGVEEIDREAATKYGIAVCNTAGGNAEAVAECAVCLMITILRDFHNADKEVRQGDWTRFFKCQFNNQLSGKTVGLIGFGNIPKALAKMLYGFNCRVLACDINFDHAAAQKYEVEQADIDTIRKEADVISLHVPILPETIGMVDMAFFKGMKPSAVIINTGRGRLIKEADLVEALQTGVIAGAGLDVFDPEPLSEDSPLKEMKNVFLLPHISGGSIEAIERTTTMSAENVVAFFNNKPVPSIVNPDYVNHLKIL